MILPKPIADLLDSHNKFGSITNAQSLDENAVLFHSGKTYRGKKEIGRWETVDSDRRTYLKPIDMVSTNDRVILKVKLSGLFRGSPRIRTYNFGIQKDKITSLIVE